MHAWRSLAAACALGSAVPTTPTGEVVTLAGWHGHGYPSRGPDFEIRIDRAAAEVGR